MNTPNPQDLAPAASTRSELTGDEGGVWRVSTQSSFYVFDVDTMMVTRPPGAHAPATINDTTRPIDVIVKCTVGESGYWIMKADPEQAFGLQDYWQVSTVIKSLERLNPLPKGDGTD